MKKFIILLCLMLSFAFNGYAITPEEKRLNTITQVKNWYRPIFIYKIWDLFDTVYFVYQELVHESEYTGNQINMYMIVNGEKFYFENLICYEDIEDLDLHELYAKFDKQYYQR